MFHNNKQIANQQETKIVELTAKINSLQEQVSDLKKVEFTSLEKEWLEKVEYIMKIFNNVIIHNSVAESFWNQAAEKIAELPALDNSNNYPNLSALELEYLRPEGLTFFFEQLKEIKTEPKSFSLEQKLQVLEATEERELSEKEKEYLTDLKWVMGKMSYLVDKMFWEKSQWKYAGKRFDFIAEVEKKLDELRENEEEIADELSSLRANLSVNLFSSLKKMREVKFSEMKELKNQVEQLELDLKNQREESARLKRENEELRQQLQITQTSETLAAQIQQINLAKK